MTKLGLVSVLFCLLLLMSACSSNESSEAPPPTAQSIIVNSSSDMLYIGDSETFTAEARMSDGTTKAVTGGMWSTDNTSVATVNPSSGQVTIVGSGTVNIAVDYEGRRGSKLIRGLPNYQGTWVGSYVIESCKATGDFKSAKFCNNFPINHVFPTDLNLTQDEDRVEGRFKLGTLSGDASGPVQTNGKLTLMGTAKASPFTIEVTYLLQSTTPGRITGTLGELFWATGWSGDGRLSCNIRDLDRTSTMAMPMAPDLLMPNPTLEDLIRALLYR